MIARYILLVVGTVFLVLGLLRLQRESWRLGPATRAWLLVGIIMLAVGTFLASGPL